MTAVREAARVEGVVQGVGFRPFVFRLAHEEGLAGHVLNDERGVLCEVEGPAAAVERFMARLRTEAPPLAAVHAVRRMAVPVQGERTFTIVASARRGAADALVAADSATCADCLRELRDPSDRRHRYPFINCTNCGPRFTIVRGVPYDRPLTTMAPFDMCPDCRREYEDPRDRRFHAQPNACPRCGPRLWVADRRGRTVPAADPVRFAAERLMAGAILAIKGLGGFHLACAAADPAAVSALRSHKHREDKPFALMVHDPASFVEVDAQVAALLSSPRRPIVLAPRRPDAPVAQAVAPGAPELGVMLPYTPLHHLLIDETGALVMTSGNVSDEPIAFTDEDALGRLGEIADLFLLHDREIATRTDDSVIRAVRGRPPVMVRRSRGFVPERLTLPVPTPRPLLACGAEQKSTFCVAKGERAWVSHHIGDLEHLANHQAFRQGIDHFERLFDVTPEVVVHDLHPGYLSTAYALERPGVEAVAVQHHHAHLAACLAEHGRPDSPTVGAIYDGTGYGADGTVWGGELLAGGLDGYERVGWLWTVAMPGGTAAIRQPWRMAAAWLQAAFGEPRPVPRRLRAQVTTDRWEAMAAVGNDQAVSPLTSSMGRLFDAVGALCGLVAAATYEGQAAVMLEAEAWRSAAPRTYSIELVLEAGAGGVGGGDLRVVLDPRAAVRALAGDLEAGADPADVAAGFHTAMAEATVAAVTAVASDRGLGDAVLSGGVFQNRLLLERVAAELARTGLRVLVPERLPPNDGGIAFGQAAVAAALMASEQRSGRSLPARPDDPVAQFQLVAGGEQQLDVVEGQQLGP